MRISEPKRPGQDAVKNADNFYKWMYQTTEALNMAFEQLERNNVLDLQAAGIGTTSENGLLRGEVGELGDTIEALGAAQAQQQGQLGQQQELIEQVQTQLGGFTILCGRAEISFGTEMHELEISFAVEFTENPVVLVTQVFDDANLVVRNKNITTTGFIVGVSAAFTTSGTRNFSWLAVGKVKEG